MSLPATTPVTSPVFRNYDRLLALASTKHRLSNGPLGVTAVLGLLDMRTGRMPIGLINAKGQYFNGLICYDVSINDIDAIDQASWNTFLGSYVGGGWLFPLVSGFGGLVLLVTSAFGAVALESFAFLFIPALLVGLVGIFFYAIIGITLFNLAIQVCRMSSASSPPMQPSAVSLRCCTKPAAARSSVNSMRSSAQGFMRS